jgi:hypothetical protein
MWNKVVWYCQNLSAVAIAFISFLVMNSKIPTESAPSRSKVLLEEIRVALERTRSSFVSKGLLAVPVVLSGFYLQETSAAEQAKPGPTIEKRIQELIHSLEEAGPMLRKPRPNSTSAISSSWRLRTISPAKVRS